MQKQKTKKILKYSLACGLLISSLLCCAACSDDELAWPDKNGTIDAAAFPETVQISLDEIADTYHDKYAIYYNHDEYTSLIDQLMGSFTGIGVYIYDDEEAGLVTVLAPIKGSPAYEAGIQPNDQILKVDGEDVTSLNSDEISAMFKSKAIGTEIKLTVNRPDQGEMDFIINVDNIEVETVESKYLEEEQLGLIYISSFNAQTGTEFIEALNELTLQDIKGLILDLRDNGGGEITGALQVCDVFVDKDQPVMYMDTTEGSYCYVGSTERTDIPLVVLCNGNTASASEVLLGCIQDNNAGTIIGTTSFGKGIVQDIIPLDSGAGLRFTSSRYRTSGGHNIHEIGITPDIEYPMPEGTDLYAAFSMDPDQDPQLKKAIEVLEEQLNAASQSSETDSGTDQQN